MMLGDVIARLEDDAFADETLVALGDLALVNRVAAAAAAEGAGRGEYVAAAVGRYAAGCADEEWLTVLGQMGRSDDPGEVLLRRALAAALQGDTSPSAGCGGHADPGHSGCTCGRTGDDIQSTR
jgi:hypothetical protein